MSAVSRAFVLAFFGLSPAAAADSPSGFRFLDDKERGKLTLTGDLPGNGSEGQ